MSGAVLRRVLGWVGGVGGAVLAVLASAGVLPAFAQAGGFGDVAVGAYYSAPVQELAGLGVLTGCEGSAGFDDSRFCPGEPMDRKTMAVWVVRVLDGEDPPPGRSRFPDVNTLSAFWWPFAERMAELGVTTGCGDGANFCPDDPVTRAQTAVFLWRAFDLPDGPDPGFPDVPDEAWYYDAVAALAASGITQGCGSGTTFCPGDDTTRAQMATFLNRARQRTEAAADDTSATPQASTSSGGGGGGGGQRTVTTTTVTPVTVRFGAASHTATEGGAAATVQVVLSADPQRTVDVPLTVTRSGGATPGDYTVSATGVTFHAGQTTASFTVTATDDSNDDDDESVTIRFGTLPPGVTAASPNTAQVELDDNDDPLGRVTMTLPAGCVLRDLGAGNEMPFVTYVDGCPSLYNSGHNAYYYRLVVREQGPVTLGVVGTGASHLLIRSASGEVIERYVEPGEIQYYRLSLTRTLDAGTYVIEVAAQWHHFQDRSRGQTLSYTGSSIVRPAAYKLTGLSITDVNLASFAPGTTEYSRNVAADVQTVTVTPTATLDDAKVTIMPPDADTSTDGHQVDIAAVGTTEITIAVNIPMVVNAGIVYRVALNQVAGTTGPLSDVASLTSLSFEGIDIGDFSSDKTDYTYPLGFYERLNGTTATMSVTAAAGATWTTNRTDENGDVAGHKLSINGSGAILVTVASQNNANTRVYRVAAESPMTRDSSKDICRSCDVHRPYGIWSDGTTMMTLNRAANTLYVFDIETKQQTNTVKFKPPSYGNWNADESRGFWTDSETVWIMHQENEDWEPHDNNLLYAYSLETQDRVTTKDILFPDERGIPIALWIDGERMYMATDRDGLYIYEFPGAVRIASIDYNAGRPRSLPYGNTQAMWSDGTTLYMAIRDGWIRAYDAESGRRVPGLDFRPGTSPLPTGIWSDGRTMWVIDRFRGYPEAYSMPENARLWKLSVSDGDIGYFHNGKFDYDVEVPAGTTSTTITAEAAFDGGSSLIVFGGTDSDDQTDGHQVALTPGEDAVVTITVTAPNGTDTEVYTVTITHAS